MTTVPEPRRSLSVEHDVAGAVDGPDVVTVAVLLGVHTLPHRGLADDVEGAAGDQGEHVKLLNL